MKAEYYNDFDIETVYYILGYMTFVCTFIISVKIITASILTSLILYIILTLAASIYLFNINKYTYFKYDIIIFLSIYGFFSIIYFLYLSGFIYDFNQKHKYILIFIVITNLINYIISVLKLSKLGILENHRVIYIISCFAYTSIITILIYSYIFASYNNLAVTKYVINNSKISSNEKYELKDIHYQMNDYLFFEPKNKYSYLLTSAHKKFNGEELNEFIRISFNPVFKLEDYLSFSAENYLNGRISNILISGGRLKAVVFFEKFIFAVIIIITIVSLIDIYKLKENLKKESFY